MSSSVWRNLVLFLSGRFLTTAAIQMAHVAVGWHVYSLTGSKLALGYLGLVQFVPIFAFTLPAGLLADRLDRRSIVAVCHFLVALCWAVLGVVALEKTVDLRVVYTMLALLGVARAFSAPAGQALLPSLVPDRLFGRAVGFASTTWELAAIGGPAVGGVLYAQTHSPSAVYFLASGLALVAALVTLAVRTRPIARKAQSWSDVLAGVRFVWTEKIVLGVISLDLFAVLLGGAVALLPVFASDILHAGPLALGALRSAPAVGAALTALVLAYRPIQGRAGLWMFSSVTVFGLATVVFGLSRDVALSLAALTVVGASDMVSVVLRQHAVQRATPDAMRGRVSAVNMLFVGASNELGEFESGVTAAWWGPVPAVLVGGLGTCLVVAVWTRLFPSLRDLDRLDDLKRRS